jgi:hypothetical protein
MSLSRKAAGTLAAALAIGALAAPTVQADSIKTCEGSKSQFTYTQKGSCESSHPTVATNPGGNEPPGQQ